MLRISHQYNVTDALTNADQMDRTLWASLVVEQDGLDYLLSPERPEPAHIERYPVQDLLEFAPSIYEVVVVDLGGVCEPMWMATLSAAQETHLVCTSDLPSLYMMRRTIPLIEELGYGRDQIHVIVNRVPRRPELSQADMEKIFRASVHVTFPDDPPRGSEGTAGRRAGSRGDRSRTRHQQVRARHHRQADRRARWNSRCTSPQRAARQGVTQSF